MRKLIILAALGFAALQPVSAQAQESNIYVVTIPTRDLNLASPAGAETLRGRALHAARQTCGESQRLEDLFEQANCVTHFMHAAETRIAAASSGKGRALASR